MRIIASLLSLLFLLLVTTTAAQQVRFGLRGGLSASASPTLAQEVRYQSRLYRVSVDDIPLGIHLGAMLQVRAKHWVFQPEVIFHSSRTDYQLEEIFSTEIFRTIRQEKFTHLEVPLMVAYRWGPLRLQVGPTARILLASSSDFEGVADYVDESRIYDVGYQAGIGLDIRRVIFDIKYDGSFEGLGANIQLGGQQLAFNNAAGRTYASLGVLLF